MIYLPDYALEEAADAANVELRTDYSGRAMYGEQCLGIVGDSSTEFVIRLIGELNADPDFKDDAADAVLAMSRRERRDSMGLSSIFYYPGYGVEGETREEATR